MSIHCHHSLTMFVVVTASWVLAVSASAQSGSLPMDGAPESETVDFERHVAPLLLKLGCHAGSCHGASGGQGGLQLSLFGVDPRQDYESLTDSAAERVLPATPQQSLLLLKATAQVDHEGGRRLVTGTPEYDLVLRWIRQGARHTPGTGQLALLQVIPARSVLTEQQSMAIVQVVATYANGDQADVTALSELRVDDDSVADVEAGGHVRRGRPGETVLVAGYAGHSASGRIIVPNSGPVPSDQTRRADDSASVVDRLIDHRLKDLRVEPSSVCSDEVFLRRLCLTTVGQLPDPQQIRAFAEDVAPDKRSRAIDRHLQDRRHAAMWATRMCEITGSRDVAETELDESLRREQKWHAWFRVRFERNEPWDKLVRAVITGRSRDGKDAPAFLADAVEAAAQNVLNDETRYSAKASFDLFWQRPLVNEDVTAESMAERIAAAFLGVRIECSRCHKHPFDRWTQNDHHAFVNIFTQVRYGLSPELRVALADQLEQQRERTQAGLPTVRVPAVREVFVTGHARDLRDPRSQDVIPPRPLGGTPLPVSGDRREEFAEWLFRPQNPYFARNAVNRVWSVCFGRGLVEPVDAFSAANPPVHPELLDELSSQLAASGYDLRALEATILNSAAWQRSAQGNGANGNDVRNYSRFTLRVLAADVLVDALSCAIGDITPRAVEEPTFAGADEHVRAWFEVFSRPERRQVCDCERSGEPTLRQAMLLLSDPALSSRISQQTARLSVDTESQLQQAVTDLFLRSLSRWPDEQEKQAALNHVLNSSDRHQALADVLWGLLNTREFVTLH